MYLNLHAFVTTFIIVHIPLQSDNLRLCLSSKANKNDTVIDSMILKAVGKGSIFSLYQHILRYIAIAMVILLAIGLLAGI